MSRALRFLASAFKSLFENFLSLLHYATFYIIFPPFFIALPHSIFFPFFFLFVFYASAFIFFQSVLLHSPFSNRCYD